MNTNEQWIVDAQDVVVDDNNNDGMPISDLRKKLMEICDLVEKGDYRFLEMSFCAMNEQTHQVAVGGVSVYGVNQRHCGWSQVSGYVNESESVNTCDVFDAFVEDMEAHINQEDGQQNIYTSVCIGDNSDGDTTCFRERKENE